MEKEVPEWLNEEFLETVLGGEPRVSVSGFTAQLAVAPGNNYLSTIYRVRVNYEAEGRQHSKSLMIKAPFTKGLASDMSDRMDVFGKELRTYKDLLGRVSDKLGRVLGPALYPGPGKALVLQDLCEDGYEMFDKYAQLDYDHCNLVMRTLAEFHAASVACHHDDPELIAAIGEERMLIKGDPNFERQLKPWLEAGVKIVAGIVAGMDGGQPVVEYMLQRVDSYTDTVVGLCQPKERGLNVLNHGDLWVNNILFKHSGDGQVEDVKFIDFQMLRFASPVTDLMYFIWTSAREDVRETRLGDLYQSYFKTLNDTLERLECEERLTEEEFNQDINQATDWIMYSFCNLLPMMQVESVDALDMEELDEKDLNILENNQPDGRIVKMFYSKRFLALLPSLVKQFNKLISTKD